MTCRASGLALLLVALVAPGCGLTLDYDPPTDGGVDARRVDAGLDGGGPECRTDVDCGNDDACDGIELCLDGVCADGVAVACGDDNGCNGIEICDPATGACSTSPAIVCADDGNPCNGVEFCDPALVGCASTPPQDCDDGIACTVDVCDLGLGQCVSTGVDSLCTAGPGGMCTETGCQYDTCNDATCGAETPLCFDHRCDGGLCVRTSRCGTGTMCCNGACVPLGCDDDNECTYDRCDPSVGCLHPPVPRLCDDGDACTMGDRCVGTSCEPGPLRCPALDACNAGLCASGACGTEPLTGTPCSDGDECTVGDRCMAGVCTAGPAIPSCDDGNPCTADSCDAATGCANTAVPDGTICGTLLGVGACEAGACRASTLCIIGRLDCDGDGSCECGTACVPSAGGSVCADVTDCRSTGCRMGETCCDSPGFRNDGTCQPIGCLGCCMFGAF